MKLDNLARNERLKLLAGGLGPHFNRVLDCGNDRIDRGRGPHGTSAEAQPLANSACSVDLC